MCAVDPLMATRHGVRGMREASCSDEFHALLTAALPRLRIHATALTRNRSEADDLVQDAVALALRHQNSFEMGTNFAGWMHRILRNRFISVLRQRRDHIDLDEVSGVLNGVSSAHEHRLVLKELARLLGELSSECREALVLIAVHGCSYQEIAKMQDCAIGTAKSRVFRARQQLKAQLLGNGPRNIPTAVAQNRNLGLVAP